jgi:hypothetical protein
MNHDDKELPEWVNLVNRVLHGQRKWEEEKRKFDKISIDQDNKGNYLKQPA